VVTKTLIASRSRSFSVVAPSLRGFLEDVGVIGGIGDDGDGAVVLGGAASMEGPPMSMFSMASSRVTPGLATVCSKG
jgi:hypothetical protein